MVVVDLSLGTQTHNALVKEQHFCCGCVNSVLLFSALSLRSIFVMQDSLMFLSLNATIILHLAIISCSSDVVMHFSIVLWLKR